LKVKTSPKERNRALRNGIIIKRILVQVPLNIQYPIFMRKNQGKGVKNTPKAT
jgi:hypothetical protein